MDRSDSTKNDSFSTVRHDWEMFAVFFFFFLIFFLCCISDLYRTLYKEGTEPCLDVVQVPTECKQPEPGLLMAMVESDKLFRLVEDS
jgi:hypothetical protein